MEPVFATPKRGRTYTFPDLDSPLPSVTTLIGLLDRPALAYWQRDTVAKYAFDHRRAWEDLPRLDAIELLRESPWRETKRAGQRGTSVHEWLETENVPAGDDPIYPFVVAGRKWKTDRLIKSFRTEATLRNTEFSYAGTADLIGVVDDQYSIIDWKTSRTTGYLDQAFQLVGLGRCTELVVDDGRTSRWSSPPTLGVVVHLRDDESYEEYRLDLTGSVADALFTGLVGLVALWQADRAWGKRGQWL